MTTSKFIPRVEFKTVTYMGYEMTIPSNIMYIATDKDGCVQGFTKRPQLINLNNPSTGLWIRGKVADVSSYHIGRFTYPASRGPDWWTQSLVYFGPVKKVIDSGSTLMREVKFFGQDFQVPDDTNYITVDKDRSIYAHYKKPYIKDEKRWWSGDGRKPDQETEGGFMFYVGQLDKSVTADWTTSCIYLYE